MSKVTHSPLSSAEVEELEKFRRQAERNKETNLRSMAKRRARMKAMKLCLMCGKAEPRENRMHCGPCAEKIFSRQKQKRNEKREKRKSLPGFCSACGHKLRGQGSGEGGGK